MSFLEEIRSNLCSQTYRVCDYWTQKKHYFTNIKDFQNEQNIIDGWTLKNLSLRRRHDGIKSWLQHRIIWSQRLSPSFRFDYHHTKGYFTEFTSLFFSKPETHFVNKPALIYSTLTMKAWKYNFIYFFDMYILTKTNTV